MKTQVAILILLVNVLLISNLNVCSANERYRRNPDKYDENYNKFLSRHFSDLNGKHVDEKEEYKQAQEEAAEGEGDYDEDESDDSKSNVEHNDSYNYKSSSDYERIKALSEAQVAKLHEKPGNCKHYEKDGMICATCSDPETGDTSESCAYSSQPNDKKVAYLSHKSHNYKKPSPVEVEEPVEHDGESEDLEEAPVTPSAKHAKPAKQHRSEIEDAGDYGAYKLASDNGDVDDYDDGPKFAHLKVEPTQQNEKVKKEFEILPQAEFESKNLNQALIDFNTKDFSTCKKVMKGDMTCYYCKDAKGATQEECMFVSSTNPKNIKLERHEAKSYDINSRRPTSTIKSSIISDVPISAPIKVAPVLPDNREKFARLRMARPLMPTKATIIKHAEPLVTPKTSINPNNFDNYDSHQKKTIKRTVSNKKKFVDDFHSDDYHPDYFPSESRVVAFETHVNHE
ncbi:hypothetical protein PVAND_011843 [Polypedilum vanderplanki]|uniref:Uncharacterized protein n=1 Tax=Polypedilum vanderplanki TaxID=319348 RepID=A0A9J6CKI5_POLVA|nr:hypothetical protein PVAND_011843 [Polypedilum vanderplanki]